MSYAKLMQIIQNSKFIIIKLLKSKLVQIPSLLILKHRFITKVQKKSESHFAISNNIVKFAENFKPMFKLIRINKWDKF